MDHAPKEQKIILESVRDQSTVLQSFRTISRIDAQRRNVRPLRFRHSQSLANRRQRFSQAIVRSTIQRLGSTTNLPTSERLTISTLTCSQTRVRPALNFGPW